jgi:hypothetical protein
MDACTDIVDGDEVRLWTLDGNSVSLHGEVLRAVETDTDEEDSGEDYSADSVFSECVYACMYLCMYARL